MTPPRKDKDTPPDAVPGEPSVVELGEQNTEAPTEAPPVPPAAEGETPEEAAQPDSVSHRLVESNLEAEPSVVKPDAEDPAPPPDVEPHPAERIFRDAEEQLEALLAQGVDRSDIELVTDSVGRLIEARRIEL